MQAFASTPHCNDRLMQVVCRQLRSPIAVILLTRSASSLPPWTTTSRWPLRRWQWRSH